MKVQNIKIELLKPDPNQPRQEFFPEEMARLKESIKEKGIKLPLSVEKENGKFLILDGERRYRCAIQLKLKELPVIVYDKMPEAERAFLRFHIQEQTQGWSAFDKAMAINTIKETTSMQAQELADSLGLAVSTINAYLSIMKLSKRTAKEFNNKKLPVHLASRIWRIISYCRGNSELKNKLENVLVNHVINGKFILIGDFSIISRAMRNTSDKEKLAKYIIANRNAKLKDILKYADTEESELSHKMLSQLWNCGNIGRKIIDNEFGVDELDKAKIKKAIKQLVEIGSKI